MISNRKKIQHLLWRSGFGENRLTIDEGDLKYHIDFRSLYATVLNKWLNANDEQILGGKFDYVSVI